MRAKLGPMSLRHWALGGYALVCALALTWPGYHLVGRRLTPYVLGLPLPFAWNVGWVALTFLVLVVFHLSGREEG